MFGGAFEARLTVVDMHTTTLGKALATAHRSLLAGIVAAALLAPSPASADAFSPAGTDVAHDSFHSISMLDGPRVIGGDVADVLIRVRGGAFCSGTPISGTVYVVTAAHCVLDHEGRVAPRSVVRDGVTNGPDNEVPAAFCARGSMTVTEALETP